MAKSIRAKIKKRLRTAKRQRIDAMIITPREKEKNEALQRVIDGRVVTYTKPKNAFKYPEDPTAVFSQHEIVKPIDFRSSHLPMAAYAFRGNRRKYSPEEVAFMKDLARNTHPEMEVMAGGGAFLSNGRHVSKKEAEVLATITRNPEAAAMVEATPASGSDAVAAAIAEAAAGSSSASATRPAALAAPVRTGDVDMELANAEAPAVVTAADAAAGPAAIHAADTAEEPQNTADHTRIPVLKDTRRAKRAAEHRPRSNAVKKKTKLKVEADKPAPDPKAAAGPIAVDPESVPTEKLASKGKKKKKQV